MKKRKRENYIFVVVGSFFFFIFRLLVHSHWIFFFSHIDFYLSKITRNLIPVQYKFRYYRTTGRKRKIDQQPILVRVLLPSIFFLLCDMIILSIMRRITSFSADIGSSYKYHLFSLWFPLGSVLVSMLTRISKMRTPIACVICNSVTRCSFIRTFCIWNHRKLMVYTICNQISFFHSKCFICLWIILKWSTLD